MHPVLGTMMPEICEAPHFSCQPRLHTQIVGMRSLHSPPSSDDTPVPGGCSDTRKDSDKKSGGSAVLWVTRGDVEAMQKAMERARYLVKYETKQHDGSGQRNYGCSRGVGRLLDGR
ncbi:Uncharacterised protein [Escherichia coli]|nr:Uncharacterised protein [Escherichia coli]